MHRMANRKYCKCVVCVAHSCGKWWEHHEHETEIVPNKLRRFDGLRSGIEALWDLFAKGNPA